MFDSDYSDCCRCAVLKIMLEKEEIEQTYTHLEDQLKHLFLHDWKYPPNNEIMQCIKM